MKKLLFFLIIPFLSFGQDVSKTNFTPCECAETHLQIYHLVIKPLLENPYDSYKKIIQHLQKNNERATFCNRTDLEFKKKIDKCLENGL